MKALPPAERAPRIFDFLNRVPLASAEVHCLVLLISATGDERALGYISSVYDGGDAFAQRKWGDSGSDLHMTNETNNIRASAVTAGGLIGGPEALAFTLRGADDPSTVVRQAAAIALAKRADFHDREFLLRVRDSLDPAQRPAVDEVL